MANRYLEHFIQTDQLSEMVGRGGEVRREVRLGESRIDFAIGETYIEVKTPLLEMPISKNVPHRKFARMYSFGRLIRHFHELATITGKGGRAILLLCYLYDAEPSALRPWKSTTKMWRKRPRSQKGQGWRTGRSTSGWGLGVVSLIRYFRLRLFQ
jgi:sugar fermentation stimulation protein A